MAWTPISGTMTQYSTSANLLASGYFLKMYQSGTTTAFNMATDSTGGTTLDKCQLDASGYPTTDGTTRFIPHVDQTYKIVLYRNATDADNNTTGSADWVIDAITQPAVSGDIPTNPATLASNVTYSPADSGAVDTDAQTKLRESISIIDYGAVAGTGLSSAQRIANTTAINSALATGNNVFIPSGSYEIEGKIIQNLDDQSVFGWGVLIYTYHNDDAAWEIGEDTSIEGRNFQARLFGVSLNYRGPGYVVGTVGGSTHPGLKLSQPYECIVNGVSANYYKYCVYHVSSYSASYYNYIHMVEMEYGEIGYYLYARDVVSDYGLIASNTILIQRCQQCSIAGIKTEGDNNQSSGKENLPGDNLFFHPSVEHGSGSGQYGIWENGKNIYLEPRIDGNFSENFLVLGADSERCFIQSHLFFINQDLNTTDLGTENVISTIGYDQKVIPNASFLAESTRRTATNSAISLRDSNVVWNSSGVGTSTYYFTMANGDRPQRRYPTYPPRVFENGSAMTFNNDISSLSAGEWGVGDQDSLGYKSIYVRLADSADPDSKSTNWLQARGMPIFLEADEKTFAAASSQLRTQAAASSGTDSYFMRGVNSQTGEEYYRIPVGNAYWIAGNQIITSRRTGWSAPSGVASRSGYVTSSATTQDVAETLKALIDDLISHGLIGS